MKANVSADVNANGLYTAVVDDVGLSFTGFGKSKQMAKQNAAARALK